MNGTKPMAMNNKELCKIFKLCVQFKVKSLKYQGLDIVFHDLKDPATDTKAVITPPPIRDPELLKSTINQVDRETLIRQELQIKEEMLDQMLIEDPLSYERLLLERDLEELDGGKGTDHRGSESPL